MKRISVARNDLGGHPKNIGFRVNKGWWEAVDNWAHERRLSIQDLGITAISRFTGIKHPVKDRGSL